MGCSLVADAMPDRVGIPCTLKRDSMPLLSQRIKKSTSKKLVDFLAGADKKDIFRCFDIDLNPCVTITPKACIESMQSIVWNPLQDGMESSPENAPSVMPCAYGDTIHAYA